MSNKKGAKSKKESANQTANAEMPEKYVPAHGRGALYTGGVPGNKGGGRPRSAVKAASLLAFERRLYVLEEISDDPRGKDVDRINAVKSLGAFGGAGVEEAIPRELVKLLAHDVQSVVRSGDFEITFVGERTQDEQDSIDEEVFLARFYNSWATTLGAYRAGDI